MVAAGILNASVVAFAVAVAVAVAVGVPIAAWRAHRRSLPMPPSHTEGVAPTAGMTLRLAPASLSAGGSEVTSKAAAANRRVADRLWRLAFGVPREARSADGAHSRVRELIYAKLDVDTLDPKYFPRRPTLMPQLLKVLEDPRAESEKLSRIIAHDPVLAADVLRLANSSLYRMSPAPAETVQRAIVVCGVDALRGILVTAMLQPAFRASRSNFPRLPRLLWERTERAARAAELYAAKLHPQDRFEAQLTVLLNALGPLVVYGTALDAYASVPHLRPDGASCVELIQTLAPQLSRRIARDWQTSPRLLAALNGVEGETLTHALHVGELLGTLSLLESQTVISAEERLAVLQEADLPEGTVGAIWTRLSSPAGASSFRGQ